jgi:hypothetical protein
MTASVHQCRVLWRGPGTVPVCVDPAHWFAPLDPHAPPARCCTITAPHRHRAPAVAPAPKVGAR